MSKPEDGIETTDGSAQRRTRLLLAGGTALALAVGACVFYLNRPEEALPDFSSIGAVRVPTATATPTAGATAAATPAPVPTTTVAAVRRDPFHAPATWPTSPGRHPTRRPRRPAPARA